MSGFEDYRQSAPKYSGIEPPEHKAAKERISKLLEKKGYYTQEEYELPTLYNKEGRPRTYRLDILAYCVKYDNLPAYIIIEVDGGSHTGAKKTKDAGRREQNSMDEKDELSKAYFQEYRSGYRTDVIHFLVEEIIEDKRWPSVLMTDQEIYDRIWKNPKEKKLK